MKKNILAGLLLLMVHVYSFGQDSAKVKGNVPPPSVKTYGAYTVTINNGKVSVAKNPKYDSTKDLRRDTTTRARSIGTIEIYQSDASTPILKKQLIYDLNSISSEHLMSKEDRLSKYGSGDGVLVVHLKPGVSLVNIAELSTEFNIPRESADLPVYLNYRSVSNPNEVLAVPGAVATEKVVTDTDGFRFLNIVTKEWVANHRKNAAGGYIRVQ